MTGPTCTNGEARLARPHPPGPGTGGPSGSDPQRSHVGSVAGEG